jgi:hypothetical protein
MYGTHKWEWRRPALQAPDSLQEYVSTALRRVHATETRPRVTAQSMAQSVH